MAFMHRLPGKLNAGACEQLSAPTENLGLNTPQERTHPDLRSLASTAQSQPISPADEFPRGTVLRDRYVIDHPVGIGGTSLVFKAHDRHRAGRSTADSCVAVKILLPKYRANPGAVRRMKREFHQMQRLTHRNIARVFDLDCHDGIWFMTMQLMEGQTLYQRLRTPAASADAVSLITQCADALMFAHEQGVVHGDLKPANIFIAPNGNIQLFDFGCAREHLEDPEDDACARSIAATLPYASPQVLAGRRPEPSDDVFSLACLAYEVMTQGEHPFLRRCTLDARRDGLLPAPARNIPRQQFDALVRGLAWERKGRPQTVRRFMQELLPHASVFAHLLKWKEKGLRSVGGHAFGLQKAGLLAAGITAAIAILWAAPELQNTPAPVPARLVAHTVAAAAPVAVAAAGESKPKEAFESTAIAAIPKAPGTVSFDVAVISVGYAQSMAVVTLKRLKSTRGRARFAWSTTGGTAKPGVDYTPVRSKVAQFADGQAVRTLYVPLLQRTDLAASHGARNFFVRLEHIPGSPALGPVTKAEVQVAGISDYYFASNKN